MRENLTRTQCVLRAGRDDRMALPISILFQASSVCSPCGMMRSELFRRSVALQTRKRIAGGGSGHWQSYAMVANGISNELPGRN